MRYLYHGKRLRIFWRGNYSLLEINVGTWAKELVIHLRAADRLINAHINRWTRKEGFREIAIV